MKRAFLLASASTQPHLPSKERPPGNRYVPEHDGVWDAQEQRYVSDDELAAIPMDQVMFANVETA